MENTLRNCVVVEDDEVNTDTVGVGNTVKVENLTLKREQTITIVGANEIDPRNMTAPSAARCWARRSVRSWTWKSPAAPFR